MSMQPKPDFLGPQVASAFREPSVAQAYRYRPPYPDTTFDILTDLIVDSPRTVLDIGCGTGYIARHLVDHVDRLDAVDISAAMIAQGKLEPNGDHERLRWIVGAIEEVALQPPYSLITAGDSIHWMDWYAVMPRLSRLLTAHGYLAILGVDQHPLPWEDEIRALYRRYSVVPNFQYHDHVRGLEERGLFEIAGRLRTDAVAFKQSLDDYVESFHARASFPRERMRPEDVTAFDDEVRTLVSRFTDSTVELQIIVEIVWGQPAD